MQVGEELDLGRGFWRLNRLSSGASIDGIRNQNIPFNSKVIDRTTREWEIVSHKSTDLRLKSYLDPRRIRYKGMSFVREIVLYQGEVRCDHKKKVTYHLHWAVEREDCMRILEWFVPKEGTSDLQEAALSQVVEEGGKLGVIVRIFRVPD